MPELEAPLSRSLLDRMIAAAKLDPALYNEVEKDESATGQAAMVVGLVAVASGVGAAGMGVGALFGALISAFLGWLVWSGVTYLIGDKLLGGTATLGELLRTLGFAQSAGVLYLFSVIPVVGGIIRVGVMIWLLVAGIIAIREALDFTTGRAILTAVLGWGCMMALSIVLLAPFL